MSDPPALATASIAAFDAPVTLSFIFDLSSPLAKIRTPSRFLRTRPEATNVSSVISDFTSSLPASINYSIKLRLTMAYDLRFGLLKPRFGNL